MKNFISLLALFCYLSPVVANSVLIQKSFKWDAAPASVEIAGATYQLHSFEGSISNEKYPSIPFFTEQFQLDGYGNLQVEIIRSSFEDFEKVPSPDDEILQERLAFEANVYKNRNGYYGKVSFAPIIKRGNSYQRLTSIELRVTLVPQPRVVLRNPPTFNSVLSDGQLYKFGVSQSGVCRLSYDFLKNDLGMDIDNIDPRQLKIYGNGGGMLPFYSESERIDDVLESHIQIVGEEDGSFDSGDYILFYAEGPHKWYLDTLNQEFNRQQNIYDDENYYFIKVSSGNGLRIQPQASLSANADYTTNEYNNFARFEDDAVNIFQEWNKAQGSGQDWYGDHFRVVRSYTYDNLFSFPGLVTSQPAKLKAKMILRDGIRTRFNLQTQNQELESDLANRVTYMSGAFENITTYAHPAEIETEILATQDNFDFQVNYPTPGGDDDSEAWLDYIQVNVRQQLNMHSNQVPFRDLQAMTANVTQFNLSGVGGNTIVWDITDPIQPRLQQGTTSGSTFSFKVSTFDQVRTFIGFNSQDGFIAPIAGGEVANQNIHGIDGAELLIVYHPDFETEAFRLAEHRAAHNGIDVATVTVEQIMNEFAAGAFDPTAIRDFARVLYNRGSLQYLLLFGDGSFDHKDKYGFGKNFVPIYENQSLHPIYSFPTDDYYAILFDVNENNPLDGDLAISVGRLPVNTIAEAKVAVDKIIDYDNSELTLGDWRNRMVFVGDDEDSNVHADGADEIADYIQGLHPYLNIDKVYLDAYPQVSTPGGDRFPAANAAINENIFKGVFAVTYLGHGGSQGWAQERVLNISDIIGWENSSKLTIFLTATCSFTGYDDPGFTTGGEQVFLNPNGGAVSLLTTVRAVFANQNEQLTQEALRRIFERQDGRITTMGEAVSRAKNSFTSVSLETNSRKFILIGDPSQPVGVPVYEVRTTQINGIGVGEVSQDTLSALEEVNVEGVVTDVNGNIKSDFSGFVNITIFDKATTQSTLGQDDGSSPFDYVLQKNVIFKGRASVTNGIFEFTFVVPKDINYEFGEGKISYYAFNPNSLDDAAGSFGEVIIGGTDLTAEADDQGPLVEVFMNTEDFIFGSTTRPNPTLLVKLQDDNGINIVGNSIGHDLEATLNDDLQNTILLNDFYESELDDYRKGEVRYQLQDLPEGLHRIRVKAWDVANNSAEGYTEFVVAPDGGVALERVLNYPNPFFDQTCFQFDHNLANQQLDILISIYTVSGRLVKTLEANMFSDGALRQDDCIQWDGRDDFGDPLAKGIYLYKVQIRAANTGGETLAGESSFEKLVILK
ncbi:MAG: type IX secretion system sortase PorU [Saprospiraceae bacterium]|nr:type IX secretion system sortase PorU [Saprospiraceae bacterium]